MSTLAGPLEFDAPPLEFLDSITDLSSSAKTLLWYGLSPKTRQGYTTAISSYNLYCVMQGVKAWPASEAVLVEWVTGRVFGSSIPKQGQIKPNTLQGYLSALRSWHVDHNLPIEVFSSPRINRVLNGGRFLFPHARKERLPITKDILEKITAVTPISIKELNVDAAFKVAWAGFFRMGEITYTDAEVQSTIFVSTKLIRSDITFSDGNQHAILRLKRSKTDVYHTGVEIILAATQDTTCPVTALQVLFNQDPQPGSAPLFRLTNKSAAFPRKPVLNILQKRLLYHNLNSPQKYTGHSFRKKAAQHAHDNGMLEQHIQKLGR